MKLQLTKDKTIDIKLPWEKGTGGGVSGHRAGVSDVTGLLLESGDPRGCPAVRHLPFSAGGGKPPEIHRGRRHGHCRLRPRLVR